MKIKITVFKPSGKYYTHEIIEHKEDIFLFKDEFKQLIRDNLPANLGNGYVLVQDAEDEDDGQTFHIALYTYEDLFYR